MVYKNVGYLLKNCAVVLLIKKKQKTNMVEHIVIIEQGHKSIYLIFTRLHANKIHKSRQ